MTIEPDDELAQRFEAQRVRLRAVAHRMLGNGDEADDAVQEAWLRLTRTGAGEVDNLAGWLTTVVSRVCLDMLRSRTSRREEPLEPDGTDGTDGTDGADLGPDPEHEAMLALSVGPALQVVLDQLSPGERLAFVLHDLFGVPFDEIAVMLGRTPAASRQLASRARRRVQGSRPPTEDVVRQRRVVDAFLAAARDGEFSALVSMLDPDAVMLADAAAVTMGAEPRYQGAEAVAGRFSGGARVALAALVGGEPGAVWWQGRTPRVAFAFSFAGDVITQIRLISDPEELRRLDLVPLHLKPRA